MDMTPEFRLKKWNIMDNGMPEFSRTADASQAMFISTCSYVNGNAHDCGVISFDIDFKGTDPRFIDVKKGPSGKKPRVISKLVLKGIKRHYPELRNYISHTTMSRNDGLSLVIKFPPFLVADKLMSDWFKGLQQKLGDMLIAIGLGVDKNAYGIERDIPNFINRDAKAYTNQRRLEKPRMIQRKDGDGNPIRNVLKELSAIVQRYKHVWDRAKKKHLDEYLYPDMRVEKKLAHYYLSTELKFTYTSQKEMAKAFGVSISTIRKMLKNPALKKWLNVEHDFNGYHVSRRHDAKLFQRAKAIVEGRADNPWSLKDASEVMDGERNNYIYRVAVILRDNLFKENHAIRLIGLLCQKLAGKETSKNVRRIHDIVGSIYKNPRQGKKKSTDLIPGFQEVQNAADKAGVTILGNGIWGLEGGEAEISIRAESEKSEKSQNAQIINLDDYKTSKNSNSVKNSQTLSDQVSKPSKHQNQFFGPVTDQHFEMLNPKPFKSWHEGKRCFNDVADYQQKKLVKHIHDSFLKPLIDSITHESSHCYIQGKHQTTADAEKSKNASRYNHSLSFDIQDYFPSIDQTILQDQLESILPKQKAQKIMDYVKQGSVINGEFFERLNGIPQGFSWSNKLSTLYLIEFDNQLTKEGWDFVRLSDDYTIYGDDQAALIKKFREIQTWLWNNRKLRIKRSKTEFDGKPVNEASFFVNFD
jgi:hypothetical protein